MTQFWQSVSQYFRHRRGDGIEISGDKALSTVLEKNAPLMIFYLKIGQCVGLSALFDSHLFNMFPFVSLPSPGKFSTS